MRLSAIALVTVGLILAAGLASAGYFVSQTLYNAKVALNTAEAKGLAERSVTADRATWQIGFSTAGRSRADIPALYAKAEADGKRITGLLIDAGLPEEALTTTPLDYRYNEYRDENAVLVEEIHALYGTITVETADVALINPARAAIGRLIVEGIQLSNNAPRYHFGGLNAIKPDMLREATRNARIAADEFASNAGVTVGGIRQARQGSFFIRDAGSDHTSTDQINKTVRVVTTITFYLTD